MVFGFLKRKAAGQGGQTSAETGTVDLTAPAFFENPYPVYERLQSRDLPASVKSGGYLLSRHADVSAALSNPNLGNMPSRFSRLHARHRDKSVAAGIAHNILPFMDGAPHATSRRLTSSAFSGVFRNAGRIIHDAARESVDAAIGNPNVELIGGIASPFVLKAMGRLFGLPDADAPQLKAWAESFFYLFAPISDPERFRQVEEDLTAFRAYLTAQLRERARTPGDDLLSALAATDADGEKLSEEQIVDNGILLFADGIENVQYAIGSAFMLIGAEPGLLAGVSQSSDTLKAAVTEALRLETPGQIIPRVAETDCEIAGQAVKRGTPVFLALGSANRDPQAFDAPDRFVLERKQSGNLSFGSGRHSCIGGQLAQVQIAALIRAAAERGLKPLTKPHEARYLPRFAHRWPESVRVSL